MKERYLRIIFIIFIVTLLMVAISINLLKAINTKDNNVTIETKTNTIIANNLRIGIIEFDTINPILSNNKNVQDISKLIFKPLFNLTSDYKIEECLAKECSKIDEKTYIVKLNENIKWHDSTKFDSSDVIFTINMIKQLKEKSIYYYNIKNISKIKKVDEHIIKIYLNEKEEYFEYNLIFPIVSSKYYNEENFKKESKNIKPVGTGKYYIAETENNCLLLKRNIIQEETNILEEIKLNLYSSLSETIRAFKMKEIDIILSSNNNVEKYLKNTNYLIKEYKDRNYIYLALNCNNEILNRQEVRNAINIAINREEILQELDCNYIKTNFPLDFGSYAYDNNNSFDLSDKNLAKNILVNKKWRYYENIWRNEENSNLKIELKLLTKLQDIKLANKIKEQLERIGIKINIFEVEENKYIEEIKKENYDIVLINSAYSYSPNLSKYYSNNNLSNYNNEEINKILLNRDDNNINEKYNRIVQITKEEIPYISLYFTSTSLIYTTNLKGIINPNSYNVFSGIENWYREYEGIN